MTNCSRADGCAVFNYPFLTQKERDNETGLDYFLARYYSSTQGRFTSPDEFTGGPDELYYFADDASANPTFYANLSNPQSLNKYQYAYNNPLRWIDPDGHDPDEVDPDPQDPKPCPCQLTPAQAEQLVNDIDRGLDKAAGALRDAGKVVFVYALITAIESVVGPLPPAPLPNTAPTSAQPATGTPPSTGREPVPPPPITMGKGSTRDVRKINPGREASAKEGVKGARKKVDDLRSKPNKTPADKAALRRAERQLQRQLDRLKKSETDAKRGRGNRR